MEKNYSKYQIDNHAPKEHLFYSNLIKNQKGSKERPVYSNYVNKFLMAIEIFNGSKRKL